MAVRIVRLGSPRVAGEGTRIGTVLRPPRGVPRERFAPDDWYDVWFPNLAPTAELVKRALASQHDAGPAGLKLWTGFVRDFRAQLRAPERLHELGLLAALSQQSDFSVGCYCENEARCHRSVLRELLAEHGARIV